MWQCLVPKMRRDSKVVLISESPVLQWSSNRHMEYKLARSTIIIMVLKFVCEFIKSYCHGVPRWGHRNVSLWPHMEAHHYVQLVLLVV